MASSSRAQLPVLIVSPSDLKRARRELESVDDFLHQAGLRQGGKAVKLPGTSRLIDALAEETGVNLLRVTERDRLLKYLSDLIERAPVLHISFASEPSAAFMSKLVSWLRTNIHPQVLVHLGLQPSIAAGCVVRTANRQFDLSLARSFDKQCDLLAKSLREQAETVAEQATAAHPMAEASPAPAADTVPTTDKAKEKVAA